MLILKKHSLYLILFTLTAFLALDSQALAFGRKPIAQPTPPPESSQPVEVIRARWETRQRDGALWSAYVYKQIDVLGKDLISKNPTDVAQFCANYPNLSTAEKKNFWVYLISAMAERESNHNPNTSYVESFSDQNGNRVVSRGLLQISIESGNAYGCGFASASDLHDPYKNLDCGLRILNRWIGRDGRVAGQVGGAWQGGARYWSVLRRDPSLSQIIAWTQDQQICWK